ncbi:BppU family phage baseplate upper protein [Lactobacillus sp. ESL0791]|uniref:BppU family phage baseplate upper protein n=1 Tax=Lactobacillus sp. ESL0791 TaxID=2983234 RepID=UPI0023F8560F|nr:BppU family phage baseplate upper protein [Lactobacillus sp. ESL0791]MDF7639927.1 BppU family phage baseplate upper protein [Lactobacillus sp. ESL0791]
MSIPVLTLCTDKNTTSVDLDRITIRQSEAGLVINANLIDADNNAYNLNNCKVSFGENKDGGKMVDDDNVAITDAIAGQISYKLNAAVYQASGSAWFEITNTANILIDTTTNFHVEVIKQADLNVDNDNYWSKAEAMLTHIQAFMNKIQNDLNSYESSKTADINSLVSTTTASINKLSNDTNATLQNYKDQLADYDAKYKTLDDNWATEIAKLDGQIDAVKQQAIKDFQTQRDQLNSDFTDFEADLKADLNSKITDINSAISTLSSTTIPSLEARANAISDKLDSLKTDFNNIDFTSFVTKNDWNTLTAKVDGMYSNDQIDEKLAQTGKVKTVEGEEPGEDGNVELLKDGSKISTAIATAKTGAISDAEAYTNTQIAAIPKIDLSPYAKNTDLVVVRTTANTANSQAIANKQSINNLQNQVTALNSKQYVYDAGYDSAALSYSQNHPDVIVFGN